ncbi:MAG TPA: ribonuclease PH [Dehalococcoidia bacterium]|nr:ribonuclease PH [Dehalococcoidia bacterium]
MRENNRKPNELRPIEILTGFVKNADGSVLIKTGNTHVICTATISEQIPPWLSDQGWITAEYSMLPASTSSRVSREITKGKKNSRSQEIQRLIGRSLRSSLDLKLLGEKSITIDCDVLNADGGTRTASITGGYIALKIALKKIFDEKKLKAQILTPVAATSIGIVKGNVLLDLDYKEDSKADVDLNIVMNSRFEIIEIQGTAEKQSFSRKKLDEMLDIGSQGIKKILALQEEF